MYVVEWRIISTYLFMFRYPYYSCRMAYGQLQFGYIQIVDVNRMVYCNKLSFIHSRWDHNKPPEHMGTTGALVDMVHITHELSTAKRDQYIRSELEPSDTFHIHVLSWKIRIYTYECYIQLYIYIYIYVRFHTCKYIRTAIWIRKVSY